MSLRFAVSLLLIPLPLAGMVAAPAAAHHTADGSVVYTVKRGDTLIGLAQKYFKRPELYRVVQRQNKIANPQLIPIGEKLRISRNILKHRSTTARLVSVRGKVSNSGIQAKTGDILKEGSQLSTAAGSYATFVLEDGSRISIPSNSDMKIRTLRRYILDNSLDYDFAVNKGGLRSKVSPLKSKNDRYRVRSPKAVSAVRGTEYQMRYDQASGSDFAEVDEGALAVSTGGKDLPLPRGKGLAVAKDGNALVENLLDAPQIIDAGRAQTKETVTFSAQKQPKESGYRFTISKDSGFVEIVADKVVKDPVYTLAALDNGSYFGRVRAIAQSGIQGMPATFTFKRRLNDVKTEAGKADDGFRFRWFGSGNGVQHFHFQLIPGSKTAIPVIDEAGLTTTEISISDLPAGDYYWRVGSTLFEDSEASTHWTPFEKLTLSN